jgi:hypothetical protein
VIVASLVDLVRIVEASDDRARLPALRRALESRHDPARCRKRRCRLITPRSIRSGSSRSSRASLPRHNLPDDATPSTCANRSPSGWEGVKMMTRTEQNRAARRRDELAA